MNFKLIIAAIGLAAGIVVIIAGLPYLTKTDLTRDEGQNFTKASLSPSTQSITTLPVKYTTSELLDNCSQNESLIYNDDCIRGLWDVSDECKNGNFSSSDSTCADPRLGQFEDKVTKEMQGLNNSLENFVSSCMNVTTDNDIGNCYYNMERIKSDCTDPKYVSMMPICNDPRFDQFDEKYKDVLSKVLP